MDSRTLLDELELFNDIRDIVASPKGIKKGDKMQLNSSPGYLQTLTLLATISFFPSLLSAQTITSFDAGAVCSSCETLPMSVNSKGDVTGTYADVNGVAHGFLRAKDGRITLFEAKDAGASYGQGTQPQAINSK